MAYSLDLEKVSIEKYRQILKNQYLLPSRKILHQNMDKNFDAIQSMGIRNIYELKKRISTPQKISLFSEKTGLSIDYLTILRREIGSIEPKNSLLKDFPGFDEKALAPLTDMGIKTSKDYYELYCSVNDKNKIARKISISAEKAEELFFICELVRINGVGNIAAKSFLGAGYKSVSDIANTTAEEMLARVSEVNDIEHYYKTKLGLKDMQFCIDFALIINSIENEM